MKRSTTGLFVILIGVSVLLANLNIGGMREVFNNYWPVYMMLAAVLIWLSNKANYLWAVLLGGAGFVLLLNNLNVTNVDFGDFILPALLITFGLSMILRTNTRKPASKANDEYTAVLSGVNGRVSESFENAKMTAVMGGIELDLSKADFAKESYLDCFLLMGGLSLRVPENIIVKPRAMCLLGGIEDKTIPPSGKDSPVLYVDGTIIMGGIEIKR